MAWANRIVGEGLAAPDQLLANPGNWRIHPRAQADALAGALDQVGYVQRIIVNKRSGHLIDGHLRVSLALQRGQPTIPVLYVDLSDDEEKLVLATLDPLAGLAARDDEKLQALLADIETDDPGLQALLDDLARGNPIGGNGDDAPPDPDAAIRTLAERFLIPPFSVLNAREGWWQDRKRAWIALGIESELGRGEAPRGEWGANNPHDGKGMTDGLVAVRARQKAATAASKANAEPGGSKMPAADYSKSGRRGDSRGRPIDG